MRSARWHGPLARPAFRRFWLSRLASNFGSFAQGIAIAWVVLREDGGALHLGVVVALTTFPYTLLALEGGVFADRFPRRTVVTVTQVLLGLNAIVLALLEATDRLGLWSISAAAVTSGAIGALGNPAIMRLVHDVVDEDELPAAIALGSVEFNVARVAGPAFAGILLALTGATACFAVNAVSFLVFAGVAAGIPTRSGTAPAGRASLITGLRTVRHVPALVTVMSVLAPVGLLGLNISIVAPMVARHVLDIGAAGFGLVSSAAGLGSVITGLVLARRDRISVASHVLGALVLSAGLLVVASSETTTIVLVGFFVFGVGMTTMLTSAATMFQRLPPPDSEGRGLGIYYLLVIGTTPLGSLLVGALAHATGIRFTVGLLGAGCLAAASVGWLIASRRGHLRVEVGPGAAL